MEMEDLARHAWALARHGPGPRTVVGLAGPPGAGKSTLAHALVAEVERLAGAGAAGYLPLDGFHLSNAQLDRLGLASRKGSAPSFDIWGYVALLRRVTQETGHDIYVPDYDRTLHEPVAARHLLRPGTRLAITEGNYLACPEPGWTAARNLMAEVWYVEVPDGVRDARLVERQLAAGRTAAGAREWVDTNDHPNGEQVKRSRENCDRILTPGDRDLSEGRADFRHV
jgi:pantothenate kinase